MEGMKLLKKISNKTVHTISLEKGIVRAHSTGIYDINTYEMKVHANTFMITNLDSDDRIIDKPEEKPPEKVNSDKQGILSEALVDDYLNRSYKTVIKSIGEDAESFSLDDFKLLNDYESSHKNRKSVIKKISEVSL